LVNVALRGALGLSADTGPLDIYSLGGMCFVQGLRLVPSAYLMIAASFRAMDPSLEEQSAMAGRGIGQTTLRVTLPIVRPALLAALIYFIIVVIESFDIPSLDMLSFDMVSFFIPVFFDMLSLLMSSAKAAGTATAKASAKATGQSRRERTIILVLHEAAMVPIHHC